MYVHNRYVYIKEEDDVMEEEGKMKQMNGVDKHKL
jgi:hypothetical protein